MKCIVAFSFEIEQERRKKNVLQVCSFIYRQNLESNDLDMCVCNKGTEKERAWAMDLVGFLRIANGSI